MNHVATFLFAPLARPDAGRRVSQRIAIAADGDADAPPFWTPARIDLARRLWGKGADEGDILAALSRLPGPADLNAQAIGALARRLCWPGPKQERRPALPLTRDGAPSMAERQAAELAYALDFVELPMEDAAAWGRANGVVRMDGEADAALLARINRARAGFRLPRFRITRWS